MECWETARDAQGVDCGQRRARHIDKGMAGLGVQEPAAAEGGHGALCLSKGWEGTGQGAALSKLHKNRPQQASKVQAL